MWPKRQFPLRPFTLVLMKRFVISVYTSLNAQGMGYTSAEFKESFLSFADQKYTFIFLLG